MKTVRLGKFVSYPGNYAIEVSTNSELGEGEKSEVVNKYINSVPFNSDNGHVNIWTEQGPELLYLLDCGQELKIDLYWGIEDSKQVPDSITIDNAEFTYTKVSPKEGRINIKKITGSPVSFHFGELDDCYYYFKTIYSADPIQRLYDYEFYSSLPYYSTWEEMCEVRDEFRIGENGVEYLAPDNNWYALYNSSKQQYQASEQAGGQTGNHLIYYTPN